MCVIASEGGREVLLDYLNKMRLPNSLIASPLWRRIHNFYTYWADPTSLLYESVSFIWFEFDLDAQSMKAHVPSFFISLEDRHLPDFSIPSHRHDIPERYKAVEMVLKVFLNRPVSSRLQRNLSACFERLPAKAGLPQVGVMLSRQSDAVRVAVDMPEDRILEYLTGIGWTGQMSSVEEILSTFYPCCIGKVLVSFNVADVVLPNIGVEFGFGTLSQIEPKLLSFLDSLVERGLCTLEKHDALLSWPGFSWEMYPGDSWPTKLWRSLSHVKISHQPGSPLMAKAYLWFSPRFALF
ncbi:hypothetical protein H8E77_18660 [bacterium]|nr:hypothetical protein [bacterium]